MNAKSKALPSISMMTLGVEDLVRSTNFYEALGWVNSAQSQEGVRFLIGCNIALGLFPRAELAKDANVENTDPGFSGVALAANQRSRADVDAFYAKAIDAGAKATKPPEEVFWGGYSGYFQDPDGHLWEVAHNPFIELSSFGVMQLSEPSP